jgi:hypothetical protein
MGGALCHTKMSGQGKLSKSKVTAGVGNSRTVHGKDTSNAPAKYKAVAQPAMSSNLGGKHTQHAW